MHGPRRVSNLETHHGSPRTFAEGLNGRELLFAYHMRRRVKKDHTTLERWATNRSPKIWWKMCARYFTAPTGSASR